MLLTIIATKHENIFALTGLKSQNRHVAMPLLWQRIYAMYIRRRRDRSHDATIWYIYAKVLLYKLKRFEVELAT